MPYADPAKQQAYYKEREERRQNDPEYIAERNRRQRERYRDPEYHAVFRKKQRAYRKRRYACDPEFRAQSLAQSLEANRRFRGLRWTDEQRDEFNATMRCAVCNEERKLHADHCHGCGAYRGGLCGSCNTSEGHLRKWNAVCPEGSPMRLYMDRHRCAPE